MRFHDPGLPTLPADAPEWANELVRALYESERRRPRTPTLRIGDGTNPDQSVYDYIRLTGAKLSTLGSDGLEVNFNPYYAFCRLSTAMTTITGETKVTPLATTLSGFTVSSDVLTCTNSGKYKIEFSSVHNVGANDDVFYLGYRVNGGSTIFSIVESPVYLGFYKTIHTTVYLSLAASDTVEFRTQRSGTGNATLAAGSEMSIIQIST